MRKRVLVFTLITLLVVLGGVVAAEEAVTAQKLLEKAKNLNLSGQFSKAREVYQKVISQFPKDKAAAQALFWQGYTYEAEGNFQQAITIYGQFVKNFPKDEYADDALRKRANIFLAKKDYPLLEEALAALAAKYSDSPYSNEANRELGELYGYERNEFAKAVAAYRKYQPSAVRKAEIEWQINFFESNADFQGKPLQIYCQARRNYEKEAFNEVEAALKKLVVDYPKSAVIDDALILLGRNEIGKAVRVREENRLMDKDLKAEFLNHYKSASAYFQQVMRDYPQAQTPAQAHFYLAQSYDWDKLGGLNDFIRAKEEYQLLLNRYPNTYWASEAAQRLDAIKRVLE